MEKLPSAKLQIAKQLIEMFLMPPQTYPEKITIISYYPKSLVRINSFFSYKPRNNRSVPETFLRNGKNCLKN